MENLLCFVAVDFIDDPNVAGHTFWYYCKFREARIGDSVIAPLGRHDRLQKGVVRKVIFAEKLSAPYPFDRIKSIAELVSENRE